MEAENKSVSKVFNDAQAKVEFKSTGCISLDGSIRCCAPGARGVWVGMQDGSVHLYDQKDGERLTMIEASETLKAVSAGNRLPRRPFWCAIHEAENGCLWLGMAAAGTTGTGILVGLRFKGLKLTKAVCVSDHQKGAVRCIQSSEKLLFTSSDDNNIVVRDIDSGEPKAILSGHKAWVNSILVTPSDCAVQSTKEKEGGDGKEQLVWSGAADGVKLWKYSSFVDIELKNGKSPFAHRRSVSPVTDGSLGSPRSPPKLTNVPDSTSNPLMIPKPLPSPSNDSNVAVSPPGTPKIPLLKIEGSSEDNHNGNRISVTPPHIDHRHFNGPGMFEEKDLKLGIQSTKDSTSNGLAPKAKHGRGKSFSLRNPLASCAGIKNSGSKANKRKTLRIRRSLSLLTKSKYTRSSPQLSPTSSTVTATSESNPLLQSPNPLASPASSVKSVMNPSSSSKKTGGRNSNTSTPRSVRSVPSVSTTRSTVSIARRLRNGPAKTISFSPPRLKLKKKKKPGHSRNYSQTMKSSRSLRAISATTPIARNAAKKITAQRKLRRSVSLTGLSRRKKLLSKLKSPPKIIPTCSCMETHLASEGVVALDQIPDRNSVVAAGRDGCVYIYDFSDRNKMQKIAVFKRSLTSLVALKGHIWVASSTSDLKVVSVNAEQTSMWPVAVKARIVYLLRSLKRVWVGTRQPSSLIAYRGSKLKSPKKGMNMMQRLLKKTRRNSIGSRTHTLDRRAIARLSMGGRSVASPRKTSPSKRRNKSRKPSYNSSTLPLKRSAKLHLALEKSSSEDKKLVESMRHKDDHEETSGSAKSTLKPGHRRKGSLSSITSSGSKDTQSSKSHRKTVLERQKQIVSAEAKIHQLEADHKAKEASLKEMINSLQMSNKALNKKVNDSVSKIRRAETESRNLKGQVSKMDKAILDLNSRVGTLKEEKRRAIEQLAFMTRKSNKNSNTKERMMKLEQKRAEQSLADIRLDHEKELRRVERMLRSRAEASEAEVKELRDKFTKLKLQTNLKNNDDEISEESQKKEISTLKRENDRITRQAKEKETAYTSELKMLREKSAKAESRVSSLQSEISRISAALKLKLETQKQSSRAEIEKLQTENKKEIETLNSKLKEDRARKNTEMEKLRREISDIKLRYKDKRSEKHAEMMNLESEHEREKKALETAMAQEKAKTMKNHKDALESIHLKIQKQLSERDEKIHEAEAKLKAQVAKSEELTKELDKSKIHIEAASLNHDAAVKRLISERDEAQNKFTEIQKILEEEKLAKEQYSKMLEAQKKEKEEEVKAYERRMSETVNTLNASIERYRNSADNDTSRYDDLQTKLKLTEQKLAHTLHLVESKKEAISQLARQADKHLYEKEEAEKALEELKLEKDTNYSAMKNQVTRLEANLEDALGKGKQSQDEASELKKALSLRDIDIEHLKRQLNRFQSQELEQPYRPPSTTSPEPIEEKEISVPEQSEPTVPKAELEKIQSDLTAKLEAQKVEIEKFNKEAEESEKAKKSLSMKVKAMEAKAQAHAKRAKTAENKAAALLKETKKSESMIRKYMEVLTHSKLKIEELSKQLAVSRATNSEGKKEQNIEAAVKGKENSHESQLREALERERDMKIFIHQLNDAKLKAEAQTRTLSVQLNNLKKELAKSSTTKSGPDAASAAELQKYKVMVAQYVQVAKSLKAKLDYEIRERTRLQALVDS
eukprot:CAMPEP_0167763798 /NCGR_PEP_ID=MMETSP0110_2-20121227/13611_1 /TAXON_ID=629695 /ORGANISM="Gymnochlora sp., Strain CCMP2014" /LENGTH=1687 /DNA_ID=CAMNT_0007650999 /DNA_START=54 /DNA_END=5117 /DNA_ORIENTATION=+